MTAAALALLLPAVTLPAQMPPLISRDILFGNVLREKEIMQVLSEYARFLEDRAAVEAAYTLSADG